MTFFTIFRPVWVWIFMSPRRVWLCGIKHYTLVGVLRLNPGPCLKIMQQQNFSGTPEIKKCSELLFNGLPYSHLNDQQPYLIIFNLKGKKYGFLVFNARYMVIYKLSRLGKECTFFWAGGHGTVLFLLNVENWRKINRAWTEIIGIRKRTENLNLFLNCIRLDLDHCFLHAAY